LGNQECKGIKALLAAAAPIKQIDKIKIKSGFKCGIILKIVDKDKSENKPIAKTIANIKNKSPILLINKALILAILAAILVYQKLTNKYDTKPTKPLVIKINLINSYKKK
jgi:hypothetical protein